MWLVPAGGCHVTPGCPTDGDGERQGDMSQVWTDPCVHRYEAEQLASVRGQNHHRKYRIKSLIANGFQKLPLQVVWQKKTQLQEGQKEGLDLSGPAESLGWLCAPKATSNSRVSSSG